MDRFLVAAGQPDRLKFVHIEEALSDVNLLTQFFDDPVRGPVDAVRQYMVDRSFCGFRFRRNSLWDPEPLGTSSAYYFDIYLGRNEAFMGISIVSKMAGVSAPELWVIAANHKLTLHQMVVGLEGQRYDGPGVPNEILKQPPEGFKAVGIYISHKGVCRACQLL